MSITIFLWVVRLGLIIRILWMSGGVHCLPRCLRRSLCWDLSQRDSLLWQSAWRQHGRRIVLHVICECHVPGWYSRFCWGNRRSSNFTRICSPSLCLLWFLWSRFGVISVVG